MLLLGVLLSRFESHEMQFVLPLVSPQSPRPLFFGIESNKCLQQNRFCSYIGVVEFDDSLTN